MRFSHVQVPRARSDEVFEVLANEQIDYVVTETAESDDDLLVQFPLPAQAVEVEFTGFGVAPTSRAVTVRVSRPVDEPYPRLPVRLGERITATTGGDVSVSVEFVETTRATA